jgi:peptide/nickel transport system permease protein
MSIVWLWTDIALWVLTLLSVFAVYKIKKSESLSRKWISIFSRPIALSSFIIFVFYIFIGLSDSIHLRDSKTSEVYSLLDFALMPVIESEEKTYSTPLNYQQFSKEYLDNGLRGFVNLKHTPDEINSQSENIQYILTTSAWSLLVAIILFIPIYWLVSSRPLFSNKPVLWTIFSIVFLLVWVINTLPEYHILGTDKAGTDVFYKAVKSIRTGMIFGLLTTLMALPPAIILGLMAGYYKGRVDDIIQYVYTTINAIPGILLIAALVLILQVYMDENAQKYASSLERSDLKLLLLCVILALTSWTGLCRLIRAETLKLSELEYVKAAKVFGVANLKILFGHLMPNVMHLVLISIVLDFSGLVLIEAILSYIGVGVDATTMSWGNMINAARLELSADPIVWWPLASSFIFMFGLVLSANLFADRVRQVFDPKEGEDA